MERFWEFTTIDTARKPRTYQHRGPDVPEAAVLEHLKRHYHGCEITGLREIFPNEFKIPIGVMESHVFDYGIIRQMRIAAGLDKIIKPSLRDLALAGRSGARPSILDRLKR